jgi:hypothetical protein
LENKQVKTIMREVAKAAADKSVLLGDQLGKDN